jgi:hypothetical protein
MAEINRDLLLSRIIHSRDLTALEKRFLMSLVEIATTPYCVRVKKLSFDDERKLLDELKHAPLMLNSDQPVYPPMQIPSFGGDDHVDPSNS